MPVAAASLTANSAVLIMGCQSSRRMAANQVTRGSGESAMTLPARRPA